jgi:hypothetical protein
MTVERSTTDPLLFYMFNVPLGRPTALIADTLELIVHPMYRIVEHFTMHAGIILYVVQLHVMEPNNYMYVLFTARTAYTFCAKLYACCLNKQ